MKKVLGIVLALCMALTVFPAMAFADASSNPWKINSLYKNFATAVSNANAMQDDTITITLNEDCEEQIVVELNNKNFVVDGNSKTLTGKLKLTGDGTHNITIKNLRFSGGGLDLSNFKSVCIEGNEFNDINTKNSRNFYDAILVDGAADAIISGNAIKNVSEVAIDCVNVLKKLVISGNEVEHTHHNSVQVVQFDGNTDKPDSVIIVNNQFKDWGVALVPGKTGSPSGRALRAQVDNLTFENNIMINANAPEEFVKITDKSDNGVIDLSGNYWGGYDPSGNIGTSNTVVYQRLEGDSKKDIDELQKRTEIKDFYQSYSEKELSDQLSYVAKIGNTEYYSLADAIDKAKDGDTITLKGNTIGSGIVIDQNKFAGEGLTIDFAGHTYTVNGTAVGSNGTKNQAFQLNKGNKITFKNGTVVIAESNASASKKISRVIQNYADLTLDNMNFSDANLVLRNDSEHTDAVAGLNTADAMIESDFGTVLISGGALTVSNSARFALAVDDWYGTSYDNGTQVTIDGTAIIGKIRFYSEKSGSAEARTGNSLLSTLTIKNPVGTYTIYDAAQAKEGGKITVPADYVLYETSTNEYDLKSPSDYVVKIGDNKYFTLSDAITAAVTAQADDDKKVTITLLDDCSGDGIVIPKDKFVVGTKKLVLDLNQKTYTVAGQLVGSTGTKTNGFQLLQGNDIEIKNGKITNNDQVTGTANECRILIQNYSDLTLDNVELDGTKQKESRSDRVPYVLSNNNGTTTIKDSKIVAAEGGVAFDSWDSKDYSGVPEVFVKGNSEIAGTIEVILNSNTNDIGKLCIEGGSFTDLTTAVKYATNGAVIALYDDVNLTSRLEITNVAITLDLAGHQVEYTGTSTLNSGVILVHNGAQLTIKDSAGNGLIKSGEKAYAAVAVTKDGDDSTKKAVLVVEGGTLEGYYYGIVGNGQRHNTEITINGGTIKGTLANDSQGIYHPQNGKLIVNSGAITGYSSAIEMRAGELIINGGTFTSAAIEFSCNANGDGSTTVGSAIAIAQHNTKKDISVTISGGTFNGVKAFNESNPQANDPAPQVSMSITGGIFNGDVSAVDTQKFISGGTYSSAPAINLLAEGVEIYERSTNPKQYVVSASAPAHSEGMNTWTFGDDGYYVESYVAPPAPTGGSGSSEKSVVSAKDEEVVVAPKASAKDGEAQVEITEKNMDKAIALAEKNESESIVLEPIVSNEAKKVEIDIPVEAAKNVVEKTDATLVVKAETAFLSIPNETLAEIVEAAEGEDIEINIAKADEKAFKEEIAELDDAEPVLAVDVTIVSGGKTISSFGGKALEVHVPVDAKKFKDGQAYTAYVFSADGSVEKTTAVIVNNEAVVVMRHFSTLVLTEAKGTVFEDAEGQWYEDMANYCYANGLFIGDENKHFNGDYIMSEAELCTVLYRIANGSEPDPAEGDEWYSTAAKWAKDNKIDETFVAEGKLARGTFIKMFYDTLKLTGKYNTKVTSSMRSALKKNAVDYDEISSSDLDAVAWSVNVKLIIGYDPNELIIQPTGEITRAEVATMLMRYYQGL